MDPEDINQEMKKKKKKRKTQLSVDNSDACKTCGVVYGDPMDKVGEMWCRCTMCSRCSMIAVHRAMEYWTSVTCLLAWTVLINQCLHTLPHNECSDEIGLLVFVQHICLIALRTALATC